MGSDLIAMVKRTTLPAVYDLSMYTRPRYFQASCVKCGRPIGFSGQGPA